MNIVKHDYPVEKRKQLLFLAQLYRAGLDSRKKSWGPIEFHRFESSSRYGHKYLCRAPELPAIIDRFIQLYKNEHY